MSAYMEDTETLSSEVLRRVLVQRLESLQRSGVIDLRKPTAGHQPAPDSQPHSAIAPAPTRSPPTVAPAKKEAETAATAPRPVPRGAAPLFSTGWERPMLPLAQRPAALAAIACEVSGCTRCQVLVSTRTQTVFGVGNPGARLCFMGEAPGADEDAQGEPFVGRAGQLLNKIIEACRLRREDVYILNTIKCRPPQNRNPLPDEVANCREYLDRQLEIIRPEFICCLGAVAAQALLGTDLSIGRMRKRFFDYRGSRVLCTYHPAYLLRNPAAKKDVWEDMQLLMREMGVDLRAN